jgi:hypothetical protein
MTPLEAALTYADAGWLVFPVDPGSKLPLTPRGHLDASVDPEQVRAWWAAWPDARIGVSLRASGLLAVDVDPRNGGTETLGALEARLGPLPRSCVQSTPQGGLHVVMRDPSPGPEGWTRPQREGGRLRGKLGPGVDVKCNGYVLAEPSPGYSWDALGPPPDVPEAWARELLKPDASAPSGGPERWQAGVGPLLPHDARELRGHLATLRRGQGHSATLQAVLEVHHAWGLSLADGAAYLEEWNRSCGRPHSAAELARQVDRVAALVTREHGARGYLRAGAAGPPSPRPEPGSFADEVRRAGEDLRARLASRVDHALSPLFEDATALMARDVPRTPWLVRGLLTEGGTGLVGGEAKTFKTWALIELALSVATGTRAFGQFPAARRRVAYYFAEDVARSVRARVRALVGERVLEPGWFFAQPRGRFLDVCSDDDCALVIASARQLGGVELLVLEPMRDLHSGEEDKSDSMTQVLKRVRAIGEVLGCTVLLAHHEKKPAGESRGKQRGGQRLRGSGAIHGAIDCGLFLSDLEVEQVGLTKTRIRNTAESELKSARSAGTFELELEIDDDDEGEAVRAAWRYVSAEEAKMRKETASTDQDRADDDVVVSHVRALQERGNCQTKDQIRLRKTGLDLATHRCDRAVARCLASGRLALSTGAGPPYDALVRSYPRGRVVLGTSVDAGTPETIALASTGEPALGSPA